MSSSPHPRGRADSSPRFPCTETCPPSLGPGRSSPATSPSVRMATRYERVRTKPSVVDLLGEPPDSRPVLEGSTRRTTQGEAHRFRRAVASLLLTAVVSACDDGQLPPAPELPEAATASGSSVDLSSVEPLVFGQPDKHFLELSEIAPEFGGAYLEDGALHVWSTTGLFPEGLTPGSDRPVVVHTAVYSFDELARWHRLLYQTLENTAQWIDIDERANHLSAAVPDRTAARQELQAAGVPEQVYQLYDVEPMKAIQTLRDEFRPVPGGVEVEAPEVGLCTAGFNVDHWEWGKTVVVPSHCTPTIAIVDSLQFNQPFAGGLIGSEVFDHPGWTSGCDSDKICRYSDAVVVDYASGIDYELGKVARPTEVGSITINESNPRFGINHEELSIFDGENVRWVGRTSGWQEGEVTKTCATLNGSDVDGYPSNLRLWCQGKQSAKPQGGDSGAPILSFAEPDFGEYDLVGIILTSQGWFSPIEGIRKELKPNSSFECDGLATTATGGCGEGDGGGGNTCDDDPTAIEC